MRKLAIAAAVAMATASAQQAVADGNGAGFTLSPMLGYEMFDGGRDLDDHGAAQLGLGYQFDNPWGIELGYLNGETRADVPGGVDVDHEQLRLDALYSFNRGESVQPYFVFGAGQANFDNGASDFDETLVNAGMGFRKFFGDHVGLRSDLRAVYGDEDDSIDMLFNLGLQFVFGTGSGGSSTDVVEPVAAAPVAAAPADADGDGVADSLDQCPGTPAGTQVDGSGCALDADGDGVANAKDECPDTEPGAKVDSVGCYLELLEDKEVRLAVQFATMSDVVREEYMAEVQRVAEFMRAYVNTDVVIEGHTDDRGAADYNQALSERRAKAVAAVLTNRFGIDANRVSAVGYGEAQPLVDNATAQNRALNRRVVAVVTAQVKTIAR